MIDRPPQKQTKTITTDVIVLTTMLAITVMLLVLFPERQTAVLKTAWAFSKEMLMILPAVLVLMGLFAVWVSRDMVLKYLGRSSGLRGVGLALLFGALPTGPLYIAFPLAAGLLKKGARVSNIVIFLTAWACIKIPQEMVELQFLGARFMLARLALTILFAVLMGLFIEKAQ